MHRSFESYLKCSKQSEVVLNQNEMRKAFVLSDVGWGSVFLSFE